MDGEIEKDLKERFNEAEREAKLGQSERAQEMFSSLINHCQNILATHSQHEVNNVRKLLALALNNRGHLKYLAVNFEAAVSDYTSAIKHHPLLAVAYYNRGLIHYRLGRFDAAVLDQQQALHINPNFTSAQHCLQQAQTDGNDNNIHNNHNV